MKPWRSNRFWYTTDKKKSASFMFGCAAHLGQPVYVIEQSESGILDPAKVYAARDDGALRRAPATPGRPETVPSWFPVHFSTLLIELRTHPSCAVVLYDGTEHFEPLIYNSTSLIDDAEDYQNDDPPESPRDLTASAASVDPDAAPPGPIGTSAHVPTSAASVVPTRAPPAAPSAPAAKVATLAQAPPPMPIPLAGTFMAKHTPSAKSPAGKRISPSPCPGTMIS